MLATASLAGVASLSTFAASAGSAKANVLNLSPGQSSTKVCHYNDHGKSDTLRSTTTRLTRSQYMKDTGTTNSAMLSSSDVKDYYKNVSEYVPKSEYYITVTSYFYFDTINTTAAFTSSSAVEAAFFPYAVTAPNTSVTQPNPDLGQSYSYATISSSQVMSGALSMTEQCIHPS